MLKKILHQAFFRLVNIVLCMALSSIGAGLIYWLLFERNLEHLEKTWSNIELAFEFLVFGALGWQIQKMVTMVRLTAGIAKEKSLPFRDALEGLQVYGLEVGQGLEEGWSRGEFLAALEKRRAQQG